MTLKYGSLFSGYGGLDLGLQSVLGGSTAWFSEFDKHPSAILAHHWPDIPNHGDITKTDFTKVEPVDVLTGGFPCQDVSHAGRRAGLIRDGEGRTRSGLWGEMLRAITELKPRLVVAENVRGLLSAAADSDVEPCPWCLGDANGEPDMRALGAVLADLADVGYDAWWVGLRAADVGAAHGRFRVFIFAAPAAGHTPSFGRQRREAQRAGALDQPAGNSARPGLVTLLPTPTTADHGTDAPNRVGSPSLSTDFVTRQLLPTPRATDDTKGGPNQRGSSGDLMLPSAVQLLPTPAVADTRSGEHMRRANNFDDGGHHGVSLHHLAYHADGERWGDYAPAIARWEAVIGRPAPAPTEPGPKGSPRLSAAFVEWLMGLPAGHVTSVDIPRNAQLKCLGNGVVPAQAAAAAQWWLAQIQETAA